MNPRVAAVQANEDFTLSLVFTNGEQRRFDVKPYLDTGVFRELRDLVAFRRVRPVLGSIQWAGGQDLCPDTLYEESEAENHQPGGEDASTEPRAARGHSLHSCP
jgi:hypothetical protein